MKFRKSDPEARQLMMNNRKLRMDFGESIKISIICLKDMRLVNKPHRASSSH